MLNSIMKTFLGKQGLLGFITKYFTLPKCNQHCSHFSHVRSLSFADIPTLLSLRALIYPIFLIIIAAIVALLKSTDDDNLSRLNLCRLLYPPVPPHHHSLNVSGWVGEWVAQLFFVAYNYESKCN